MYIIYSDEAGTSSNELVTVVASYIAYERDLMQAIKFVRELFDEFVPAVYRENFTFHAYKIWGNPNFREGWDIDRRSEFIAAMSSVPRLFEGAISISKVRRDSKIWRGDTRHITKSDFHHMVAFGLMVGRSDKYVRDWGALEHLAVVVAEDVPEKRRILKLAFEVARENDPQIPLDERYIIPTAEEKASGKITQTLSGRATRVVDTVHFATRESAILLQVADACAFVFRRYLNAQSRGEEWLEAMLGNALHWEDWQGPVSSATFRFHADRHT